MNISVVIPTRNRPQYLKQAIASILGSPACAEIIVVDDGSDPSQRCGFSSDKVRTIRNEHSLGVCAARNRGFQEARGEWVIFLDDDDELLPGSLDDCARYAAEHASQTPFAISFPMIWTTPEGAVVKTARPVKLPRGARYFLEGHQRGASYNALNGLLVPSGVFREIGGWDESMHGSAERTEMMLRLNARCSLEPISNAGYVYRVHSAGRMSQKLLNTAQDMHYTLSKHWPLFLSNRHKMAHYMSSTGVTYLRAGKWLRAVMLTGRAVMIDPRQRRLVRPLLYAMAGPLPLAVYRHYRHAVQA